MENIYIYVQYIEIYIFQEEPTPEKEFAEYTFKHNINITSHRGIMAQQELIVQIAQQMTALMNTSGGLILLYDCFNDRKEEYSDEDRDKWLRTFQEKLWLKWIPKSLFSSLVRYKYRFVNNEIRIYIFVCRSQSLSTLEFNACDRRGISVWRIYGNEPAAIEKILTNSDSSPPESQIKLIVKEKGWLDFGMEIRAKDYESGTMEFKHGYTDRTRKQGLTEFNLDILKVKMQRYIDCLCAFANTQGGSLVVGVEEGGKLPVVRGFPIRHTQEEEEWKVTCYLADKLRECIWHGDPAYKPVQGKDWDVYYHKVLGDVKERRMIEVCISKHSGSMFLRTPVFYDVPDNWEGEISKREDFNLWKKRFLDTRAIPELHEQEGRAVQEQPVTVTEEVSAEVKTPKSFNESQSEYKSDIEVHAIRTHDCLTEDMSERLKTFKGTIWYPCIEIVRERLPRDACSDNLISFLEKKQWKGLVSVIEIERKCGTTNLPGGYTEMCHMLGISKKEAPLLICCFTSKDRREINKQDLENMVTYALDSGRVLKRGFAMSTANQQYSCMFHFDIEVLLVSAEEGVTPESVWNSDAVQPVLYPKGNQKEQYTVACNGLSEYLLRRVDFVHSRYGDIRTAHLTTGQAKIVNRRPKLLIMNGRSGTGKTAIALDLARKALAAEALTAEEAMKMGIKERERQPQHVLYICSNKGMKSFVKYLLSRKYHDGEDGECESLPHFYVIVLKSTDDFSPHMDKLYTAGLIIMDDVHAIQLAEDWETNPWDLYRMVFAFAAWHRTRVAIFFDPEQDYKKHLPEHFDGKLRRLAEMLPHSDLIHKIEICTLTERIRSRQIINSFLQANQKQAKIDRKTRCLNERQGDDAILDYIGSNEEESANILNAKLRGFEGKYEARSVAILCDDNEQMDRIKEILEVKFKRRFQEDNKHPIEHTVMCSIEDFGGQEAEVILFILPRRFTTKNIKENWKYVHQISSRAIERLEFLLPLKSEETEEENIVANLQELFKIVSSDF